MTFDEYRAQLIARTKIELDTFDLDDLPPMRRRNIEWRVAYVLADHILPDAAGELAAITASTPELTGSWAVPARFRIMARLARETVESLPSAPASDIALLETGVGYFEPAIEVADSGFGEILAALTAVAGPEMSYWGADSLTADDWNAAAWDHLQKYIRAFVPDDIGAEELIELFACRPGLLDDDDMSHRLDLLASVRGRLIEETIATLRPDAAEIACGDFRQHRLGGSAFHRIELERRRALALVIERRAYRIELEIPDGLVEQLAANADEAQLLAMIETIDQMDDVPGFLALNGLGSAVPSP